MIEHLVILAGVPVFWLDGHADERADELLFFVGKVVVIFGGWLAVCDEDALLEEFAVFECPAWQCLFIFADLLDFLGLDSIPLDGLDFRYKKRFV